MTAADIAKAISPNNPLDLGIAHAVKILMNAGVHTLESCEGGEGHSYCDPTVRLHGSPGEGWRALAICLDHGMPVMHLSRQWQVNDGEPDGPYWEIVFHPRRMAEWSKARS